MKPFTKIIFLITLSVPLFAEYTNCRFKNKDYSDICKNVVQKGVDIDYTNRFLLSYFKTLFYDEITWKYIQPSKIQYHREKEKQANNVLLSYVPKMVANLKKYKKVYDKAEAQYGVNREIIAAILLKESKLGKIKPSHDAFIVFNTILLRTKPKTRRDKRLVKMSKTNMAAIIEHCYKGGIEPDRCSLPSSYAGAIGIPQFMPNSFIYTKSYKGKVADLTKMEDAILSCAKFLHDKAGFDTLIDFNKLKNIAKIENDWYAYAYKHKNGSFVYEKNKNGEKYHCFTKNKPQLYYIRDYAKKIMRYNNSSNYALGVLRLAYEAHLHLIHQH